MRTRIWFKGTICIIVMVICMIGWSLLVEEMTEHGNAAENRSFIRLHVLANSDSEEDQHLKLLVRDAVINYLQPILTGEHDKDEVKRYILTNKPEIIRVASETLLAQGVYYPVNIEYGVFDFPVKSYGELVVPSGKYEAVRILIGNAQGANWWCVLFPPLCFVDESKVVHQSSDQVINNDIAQVEQSLEFRWKVAEFIKSL